MWLGRAIRLEQHDSDKKYVHMADFAVRIKNLPDSRYYDNLDQLKAQLSLHLSNVVSHEPNVFDSNNDLSKVDPAQIISVHFSQTNFEKYKVLLDIDKLSREGQKMRTKEKNTLDKRKKRAL